MRIAIVYFVVMSLVISGVFGILSLGTHLDAPASVKGKWAIEAQQFIPGNETCGGSLDWEEYSTLTMIQSGPDLEITLGDTYHTLLMGSLMGEIIIAKEKHPHGTTRGMELEGKVDRQPEPDRLEATLTLPRCGSSLQVTAIRVNSSNGEGDSQ